MNKTTKITLNYGIGLAITVLLFWNLYAHFHQRGHPLLLPPLLDPATLWFGIGALLLLPLNLGLEARKWQLLAGSASPLSFRQALTSLLGGIAFSFITPNRIGEYPGRILMLDRHSSTRLISVSVLGGCAQLLSVLIFGSLGLAFYCFRFGGIWPMLLLVLNVTGALGIAVCYRRFEQWAPYLERIRWLHRLHMYARMLHRFSGREQAVILGLSLLRFGIYTFQYYLMLRWLQVELPFLAGFLCSALFFWAMAVIPSIALAELGIRGQVGWFIFHSLSPNDSGIFYATMALWCLNLFLPALAGSVLLLRRKLLR